MTKGKKFTATAAAAIALSAGMAHASEGNVVSVCKDGWSVTDVDGNGYVTDIEMNAYAKRQVSEMDTDESGSVSRDEYVNCKNVLAGMPMISDSRNPEDLVVLDTDSNGRISPSEFMNATWEQLEMATEGNEEARDRMNRLLATVIGNETTDGDEIGLEEMAVRAAHLYISLDQDGDRELTREEFLAEAPPMADMSETLGREFDEADTDASGELTTTELIALNERYAERAMMEAEKQTGEEADTSAGAPVVYYRYESTM